MSCFLERCVGRTFSWCYGIFLTVDLYFEGSYSTDLHDSTWEIKYI